MAKLDILLRSFGNKYDSRNYILNDYFSRYKPNARENINYMSAAVGPDGVTTHQETGEVYTEADRQKVKSLPFPEKEQIHENILTGQHIDKIYQDLMNSEEGKELVTLLKKNGNGSRKPGSIDDIIVKNLGDGVVLATMPDYVRSNLIVNADYINTWAQDMSRKNGLPYEENIKTAIVHEISHYHWQKPSDRNLPMEQIEFNNDYFVIRFYTNLAKKNSKDEEKSSLYVKKAELLASRYGGKAREFLENYIQRGIQKDRSSKSIADSASDKQSLEYRLAA